MLYSWIPKLPPGYSKGTELVVNTEYYKCLRKLSSQIQEGLINPKRIDSEQWVLHPNGYSGFFNCENVSHVVIKQGDEPLVPWFNQSGPALTMTTRELERKVKSGGYEEVPGGKGSHTKYRSKGRPMIIIPQGKTVSVGVIQSVAEALGINTRELAGV